MASTSPYQFVSGFIFHWLEMICEPINQTINIMSKNNISCFYIAKLSVGLTFFFWFSLAVRQNSFPRGYNESKAEMQESENNHIFYSASY